MNYDELIHSLHAELGRKGGQKTLKKYGKKHFSALAQKRWSGKKAVDKSGLRNTSGRIK